MRQDEVKLNEWIKPCENHLYWSATSTFSGNGMVIWAKFKSFLKHMVNTHSDRNNPLFDKCAHESDIILVSTFGGSPSRRNQINLKD